MAVYKGRQKQNLIYKGGTSIASLYKGMVLVYRIGFAPVTFTENGIWTVPPGIRQIRVDCVAGQGLTLNAAAVGGNGGRVQCILSVTPKTNLYIKVGKQYTTETENRNDSMIYINNDELQALVQAGGGGSGSAIDFHSIVCNVAGGAGGGLVGGAGGVQAPGSPIAAQGGSQGAGGAGAYAYYAGIWEIDNRASGIGRRLTGGANYVNKYGNVGCGGGGYYGGGGGVTTYYFKALPSKRKYAGAQGSGGGSSYTHPMLCSEVVHTQGFKSGNGYITISMV